jgi:copper homeostasis protein (lipoprotein)
MSIRGTPRKTKSGFAFAQLLTLILFETIVCSCMSASQSRQQDPPNSQSEVRPTRFAGTLPCADCSGIRTVLDLYQDAQARPTRYDLTENYIGTRDGDRTFTTSGKWTLLRGSADDANAIVYQLDSDQPDRTRNYLKDGDQTLRLLDRKQATILPVNLHLLTRVSNEAVNPTVVTMDDAERPIRLVAGQWLIFRLSANPSTGFRWALAEELGGGLVVRGERIYATYPPQSRPGGGGIEIWQMEARRIGEHKVHFVYRRPSETGVKPQREAVFTVQISQ